MRCWWDQPHCILFEVNASAGEALRDLARSLRVGRQGGVVRHSPSNLVNESSSHELNEQPGLCMMEPLRATSDHIPNGGDTARGNPQKLRPHISDSDGGVYVAWIGERMCDRRTWRKNGRVRGLARVKVDRKDADLNFPHLQHLPFWTFGLSSPLPCAASLPAGA